MFEPVLREMGAFRPEFTVAPERACENYADFLTLQREVPIHGRSYKTTNKARDVMIRPHPLAAQLADTDRRLESYRSGFGLDPTGRAKLLTTKQTDDGTQARENTEEFFR